MLSPALDTGFGRASQRVGAVSSVHGSRIPLGVFPAVRGITAGNSPTIPSASGVWTPAILRLVSARIINAVVGGLGRRSVARKRVEERGDVRSPVADEPPKANE